MQYKSYCYEDHLEIQDVIHTDTRLVIDFIEEGWEGHFRGQSTDGFLYQGTYGYPLPDTWRHAEFRRYKGPKEEVVFVGRWWEEEGSEGTWLIVVAE
jgi:hypothetical protein